MAKNNTPQKAQQGFIALALAFILGAIRGALFAAAVAVAVWGALAPPAVPAATPIPAVTAPVISPAPVAPCAVDEAILPRRLAPTPRKTLPWLVLRGYKCPKGHKVAYGTGSLFGLVVDLVAFKAARRKAKVDRRKAKVKVKTAAVQLVDIANEKLVAMNRRRHNWWITAALAAAALNVVFGLEDHGLVGFGMAIGGLDIQPHSNFGRTIQAIKRRGKWRPIASIELGGTQDSIKVIPGTAGADNIGLMAYCEGLNIDQPNAGDLFVIQANGVNETVVQAVAAAFVKKGWVPLTARLMVRVKNADGKEASGAELVRRLSAVMGDTLNVRSYGSFLTAPALRVYERRDSLVTEREGGEPMEVLIFTGPAGQVFEGLAGTEGGLLCSEKAHEAIFATKKPGQPRVFINHPALVGSKAVEAMFKGNISPVAQRAFKQVDGTFVFKTRAHFSNDEAGKAEWRKGYDFLFIEEDTPKGAGAKELKTKQLTLWPDMHKHMFGWLLAEAQEEPGNSLVSYQVASLISAVPPEVEGAIDASVEKRIARTYAQATGDLGQVGLPEDWVKWLAQFAPASNRASRQNHLGMGLQASTGYIHMNTLFGRGWIVTGDEFGGLKGKKLAARKEALGFDHTCGGKNPILDSNQTWVGKLLRLSDINKLLAELVSGNLSDKAKGIVEGFMPGLTNDQRIERLRWVLSFAPSLTRGSILMNADDVADLAGDDDGDQLWFMVGDENALAIFREIKRQAKGNPDCSIENNKVAQRPSAIGERPLADLLTAQGSDLMAMVKFIMAPNKGQGPVGFLANLGTVLNTFFKKVPNAGGGLSFENEWVGKLQAVLNLMQQTAIDTQKREYIPVDPVRWTLSQLDRDVTGPRGLIPGYDFPAMGHAFDKSKVADPNSLTKAQYSAALTVTSIPMVPHHWSGTATSFLTATDTQYNLSALGSWLIWECVSLLATGKPANWGVEMAPGAEGGLRPWDVAFTEDGPDIDSVFAQYNCSAETQATIKRLWVDKASKLYAWKSAPKHKAYSMAAPPALEANHRLALSHMAELTKDAVEPEVDEAEMLARLSKKFKMNLTAEVLSRWVKDVIEAFYVNAAINQGQKADSERFQHSSERSGVESLRYLVDAVETAGDKNTRNKMGSLASLWLNTHSRIDQDEREKGLAELAMIFAWWQVKYGWQWVVEESLVLLNANHHKHKAGAKLVDTWTNLGVPADMVGKVVNYMGRYRNNQRRKPSDEVMGILLDVLALNGVDMERKQARQFFFTDDALGALIKCKENALLVKEAKDNREALGETIRTWQESRRDWNDEDLPIEIMREAFGAGKALWFEEVTDGLDDLAKQVLTPEQVKALPKGKSAERSKHLKAVKAKQMLDAIEAYKSLKSTVKTEEILDQLFNPGMNPLAELFTRKLKDACGPVLNVERAWLRASEEDRHNGDWCLDLGEEISYKKRDPESGRMESKNRFLAFSRIEWSLPAGIEAEFTRTLLEGGVSFYKLSKLYTDSVKAWRYFDAVAHKALGKVETDLSLVYGLGHLISEAVSITVAERRKESKSRDALARYVRREYINQLEEDLKGMNKGPDADPYVQGLKDFLAEEKARLAAIETSPLFGLWGGGLRFPATWGMTLRSFASELTTKKLNGRAMNAIITAGRKNPEWHEQPTVIDENGVKAADVTTALEPVWENVNRAVPWDKPKSRDGLNRRAAMRQAKQDLDDSVGLVPFELEGAKMSYEKWLEDIKAIIVDNDNDACCLLPAALWFKGHIGRIGSLCGGKAADEMVIPMQKALMKTPARDIQLHLLDLLNSEELPPQPNFQRLDRETVEAFFAVIEEITKR